MNANDLFNLANNYMNTGNSQMAMQLWQDIVKTDPMFGPAYINMFNVYNGSNNLQQAKDCLEKFLNCPLTGRTIDMLPKIREELNIINNKLDPKPAQPTPQPTDALAKK